MGPSPCPKNTITKAQYKRQWDWGWDENREHEESKTPQPPPPLSEPISSYSQIWKFPSYRKAFFHNAVDYMRAKRLDDDIGLGLWRVHDKLYDLRPFARSHPGGQDWIDMTNGTDITEAFETSHILNRGAVCRILDKYYVRDVNPVTHPRNSPFTFEPSGFYRTLQARVEPVLRSGDVGGPGPSKAIIVLQDTLAVSYLLLALVSVIVDSFLLQLLAGLLLALTLVCAHNFFHIKDNWRKYYFDLSLLSSYEWRLGHALSHHLYPNTVLDYEVYLMEPWMELGAGKARTWLQKYASHVYVYLLYSQYFNMELLKRLVNVFVRRVQKPRWENFIPLVQVLIHMAVAPLSPVRSFLATVLMHIVASTYFSVVGAATAAHHHPTSFHEGDTPRGCGHGCGSGNGCDFGLCQLDVVRESTEEYAHNMGVACVTFGEHPLHHLFPTVCHSKLHVLQPAVNSVLEEFCEEIQSLNSVEKYSGIHRQLNRQSINDFRRCRN